MIIANHEYEYECHVNLIVCVNDCKERVFERKGIFIEAISVLNGEPSVHLRKY